jgi:pyruvate dehydrogenase E1 component
LAYSGAHGRPQHHPLTCRPRRRQRPGETAEWRDAFLALVANEGPARARFILDQLAVLARAPQVGWSPELVTPYVNTHRGGAAAGLSRRPGRRGEAGFADALERAGDGGARQRAYGELGGHIASYASAADLFEVGFNHFFRPATTAGRRPGVLPAAQRARRLCPRLPRRRLTEERPGALPAGDHRAGSGARGLSSYPHPWLMPDFWQFPTGSMGIGPISSIYHARFMRYLTHRSLLDCEGRKVWGVFGDGEMDEPESMSALTLASREKLDNLVWVVNCNLQRLDGPVRGNGRIVDELEKLFRGAGWNVIKLLWGSDWDGLFARDVTGALVRAFAHTVDGQMQTFAAKDGRFNRDTSSARTRNWRAWRRA